MALVNYNAGVQTLKPLSTDNEGDSLRKINALLSLIATAGSGTGAGHFDAQGNVQFQETDATQPNFGKWYSIVLVDGVMTPLNYP